VFKVHLATHVRSGVAAALFLHAASAVTQTPVPVDPPGTQQVFIRPAEIDDTLEVTGETIAAKQVQSRMSIAVRINGKGPFRFFVDSGADRSVVGVDLAARLGLEAGDTVRLHNMGTARDVPTFRVDTLAIGSTELHDIEAPALREEHLGGQGIVGIDALAGQRMTMDFEKKTITVQSTSVPDATFGRFDEVVVTARRRRGQLILTQAMAGRVNLSAVIDSGAEVTIGNSALRQRLLTRGRKVAQQIEMLTVTGETILADLIIVPEVRIGGITMNNLPVAFADVPPFGLFGLAREPAVLLGTDVMQGFRRVSLDFRNRKVRFILHRMR
jgi:predicted aspartyl protease